MLEVFAYYGPPAFALASADGDDDDGNWDLDDPTCCLAVTHVCRLWRAYALNDPLLWTIPLL
jgi:hypothetical protein